MGLFFVYILKASVCLALFYLFYKVLLSKETFHRFNRMALLGLLVLSATIPAIKITAESAQAATFGNIGDMWMINQANLKPEESSPAFNWGIILVSAYLGGTLFFFAKYLYAICRMLVFIRHGRISKTTDGFRLVIHDKEIAPFSWMHYIVISEKDADDNLKAILAHEKAHARLGHSWDIMLAEACIWLHWFNPAAWLLKRELQDIHEYEADEAVLTEGINAKEYQSLLIKKAVGSRLYSLANSINHSSLKKRITMMMKKKSNPWASAKYLYVLPLAAVAVAAFARPEISQPLNEVSSVKVTDFMAMSNAANDKNAVKADAAQEKIIVIGHGSMDKDSIKSDISNKNITIISYKGDNTDGNNPLVILDGKEYIGNLENLNPETIESISVLKDKESISRYGEKGKNGVIVVTSKNTDATKPLIILDGKEYLKDINEINPESIESISVLKDEKATSQYGEKGKNGVILITSKKK